MSFDCIQIKIYIALNLKMHPRNVFKNPPCFKTLAIKYPEFKQFMTLSAGGRIEYNFQNAEALRTLSKILLREYFDIYIDIPEYTLIPTVPLRLNYILWLEDIAECFAFRKSEINVIDIGAGATCIYGLLMAKLNEWKVMALERADISYSIMTTNVQRNHLEHLITCKKSDDLSEDLLLNNIDTNTQYSFCMSNPPFFEDFNDGTRTEKTKPPRNAASGNPFELKCGGGEVQFIKRLIRESVILKQNVRVFTTMVGIKKNLRPIRKALKQSNVKSFTQTEFQQGVTTRWAIAWTHTDLDLTKCNVPVSKKLKEESYIYVARNYSSVIDISKALERILTELKSQFETTCVSETVGEIKVAAYEDRWTHVRRRRRNQARHAAAEKAIYSALEKCTPVLQTDFRDVKSTINKIQKTLTERHVALSDLIGMRNELRQYYLNVHNTDIFLRIAKNNLINTQYDIKLRYLINKTKEKVMRVKYKTFELCSPIVKQLNKALKNNRESTDTSSKLKRRLSVNDEHKNLQLVKKFKCSSPTISRDSSIDGISAPESHGSCEKWMKTGCERNSKHGNLSKTAVSKPSLTSYFFDDQLLLEERYVKCTREYDSDTAIHYDRIVQNTRRGDPLIEYNILFNRVDGQGVKVTFAKTNNFGNLNILYQIMTYFVNQLK